jgi:sugar transferase (PEP-CTERM system associated)
MLPYTPECSIRLAGFQRQVAENVIQAQVALLVRLLNAYFPNRTLFLGISEACLVSMTFVAASAAQLGTNNAALLLGYQRGSLRIVVVSALFVMCMYYFDLYDSSVLNNRREALIRLGFALGTAYILLALLYFLFPPLVLGPRVFIVGSAFVAIVLLLWRNLFSILNSVPRFADRALIMGEGPLVEHLLYELESRPELGLRVVGRVTDTGNGNERGNGHSHAALPEESFAWSACKDLSHTVELLRANRIVVAMGERRSKLPVELLLSLKCRGVSVQEGTEVYEKITGKVHTESVRLSWLLFSPGCLASRTLLISKRCADILSSLIGLTISLPLLPFVVLAIRLTSRGPVLYRQKRTGRNGVVFECHKFRTMRADAEADTGPTWALDDDPRITPVGRFLRQSRMDEIPQLWNVLCGEMSLVGPRPERPEFVKTFIRDVPYYSLRHSVRPGITGWAQIRYKYANSVEDAKEKLRYDLFYIKNMSMGLDLLIFFQTLKVILLGRGAK